MASASLTALIAVIHLKSHTRDFWEQGQVAFPVHCPVTTDRWVSRAVKTDDDAFTLSLSIGSGIGIVLGVGLAIGPSITFKSNAFMSSSSYTGAAVFANLNPPLFGTKTIWAFTFPQRCRVWLSTNHLCHIICLFTTPKNHLIPDILNPSEWGYSFSIFTNPI